MNAMDTPVGDDAPRAQAVRCGTRALAWPHGVARAALDKVELSAVPHAPAWLAGAANIDGRIVPVIDLVPWMEPGRRTDVTARDTRLLVLGEGDETTALLFTGLPRLVRVGRRAAPAANDDPLVAVSIGCAEDDPTTPVIDHRALLDALAAAAVATA